MTTRVIENYFAELAIQLTKQFGSPMQMLTAQISKLVSCIQSWNNFNTPLPSYTPVIPSSEKLKEYLSRSLTFFEPGKIIYPYSSDDLFAVQSFERAEKARMVRNSGRNFLFVSDTDFIPKSSAPWVIRCKI
ncbi:hypothetical protein RF11_07274 [Thelohanellus kitauei]|uniref:Uncharacterized protein n=1 Tax=Thelohanellus kitauei TaxID=669202 RepID=A0A0C2N716_THEKT|nr:hypothetical protein RF11_07274 [Thelohanellus kitauei]